MSKPQSLFHRLLKLLPAAGLVVVGAAHAQAPGKPCAFRSADLAKAFGVPFDEGKAETGIGPACTYTGKGKNNLLLWVGFVPASGPFESMRFMIGPAKTQFAAVPGDADQARTVVHAPDVPNFPHIVYMRGGQLVQVHLRGIDYAGDPAGRRKQVADANAKLLALPRLP